MGGLEALKHAESQSHPHKDLGETHTVIYKVTPNTNNPAPARKKRSYVFNKDKQYSISDFAKRVHVPSSTIRLYDNDGRFKAAGKTKGRQRYYTHAQIAEFKKFAAAKSRKRRTTIVSQQATLPGMDT